MDELDALLAAALKSISTVQDVNELEQLRVLYLGKKGSVTQLLKGLGKLPAEQRPQAGESINKAKQQIHESIAQSKENLLELSLKEQLLAEAVDVTLPGRRQSGGGLHPVTKTIERMQDIFESIGY